MKPDFATAKTIGREKKMFLWCTTAKGVQEGSEEAYDLIAFSIWRFGECLWRSCEEMRSTPFGDRLRLLARKLRSSAPAKIDYARRPDLT